jgi:hypothetical protein
LISRMGEPDTRYMRCSPCSCQRRVNTKDTKDTKEQLVLEIRFRSIDDSVDARSHVRDVEVQEESELQTGEFQVGKYLSPMDWQNSFHTFDFNDKAVFDDEVHAVGRRQANAVIHNGQVHLVLKMQTGLSQLVIQATIARAFENARAESSVHSHCSAVHDVTGFVGFHESNGDS